MVRGFSSPTGRRAEPKQAFRTPRDDHDQSTLSCQNHTHMHMHMHMHVAGQPERVPQSTCSRLAEAGRG